MNTNCFDECSRCANNSNCLPLYSCISNCGNDTACASGCATTYADAVDDYLAFVGEDGCILTQCANVCPTL